MSNQITIQEINKQIVSLYHLSIQNPKNQPDTPNIQPQTHNTKPNLEPLTNQWKTKELI